MSNLDSKFAGGCQHIQTANNAQHCYSQSRACLTHEGATNQVQEKMVASLANHNEVPRELRA